MAPRWSLSRQQRVAAAVHPSGTNLCLVEGGLCGARRLVAVAARREVGVGAQLPARVAPGLGHTLRRARRDKRWRARPPPPVSRQSAERRARARASFLAARARVRAAARAAASAPQVEPPSLLPLCSAQWPRPGHSCGAAACAKQRPPAKQPLAPSRAPHRPRAALGVEAVRALVHGRRRMVNHVVHAVLRHEAAHAAPPPPPPPPPPRRQPRGHAPPGHARTHARARQPARRARRARRPPGRGRPPSGRERRGGGAVGRGGGRRRARGAVVVGRRALQQPGK